MSEKLRECPFCRDGKGELCGEIFPDVGAEYSGYSVRCRTCFAKTGIYTSEEEAIHAWNRRADHIAEPDKMVPLTLDELREMNGEPVWVKKNGRHGLYRVVKSMDRLYAYFTDSGPNGLHLADYAKTWLAYKIKPEQ